jgi:hypothetical protein
MVRLVIASLSILALTACGLAETATTGASIAASEAESARQAHAAEKDIEAKIAIAQQTAAEQRLAAEASTEH